MSELPEEEAPEVAYFACEPLAFLKPEVGLPPGYLIGQCEKCERDIAIGPRQSARYAALRDTDLPAHILCYLCILKVKSPDARVINLNKGTET